MKKEERKEIKLEKWHKPQSWVNNYDFTLVAVRSHLKFQAEETQDLIYTSRTDWL